MKQLNVYIIDSCVLMRRTLIHILGNTESVTIIGSTSGKDEEGVIYALNHFKPDVILLGVDENPSIEMHLFSFIRKNRPDLPVILVTPYNKEGATIALSGLKKGAVDYITKPDRKTSLPLAQDHFLKRVVPAVNMIPALNRDLLSSQKCDTIPEETETIHDSSLNFQPNTGMELVAVAGCIGGIQSLYRFISGLPDPLPVPIVIVQHIPGIYTDTLVRELNGLTALSVREVKNNCLLSPGQVYVAPGGYHTVVKNQGPRKYLSIHRGPREHKNRPSIDVFMRSASQAFPGKTLAVFLSGGGTDGVLGAKQVADLGGEVILENRESALLWDLPEQLREKGISDGEYSADRLGREIVRRIFKYRKKSAMRTYVAPSNSAENWAMM